MEPDYKKHADEVIDRFRLKRSRPAPQPEPAQDPGDTRPLVINAPQDCVFYFGPPPQPAPAPKARRAWLGLVVTALKKASP